MPLPVLSIARMRQWEQATWNTGRTELEVIRRVGKAVAETALRLTQPNSRVLILAGKGNNGQDALCARDYLESRQVDVLQVTDPEPAAESLRNALQSRPALIIDGLFGIGVNRALDHSWVSLIEGINSSQRPVLAVDLPSGLNADSGEPMGAAVRADVTLTVGAPKEGMLKPSAWEYVGRLEVASDVGLVAPPEGGELRWTTANDFGDFPPARHVLSHKGTFGHLGILAGSRGFHGAAVLASRGAQRAVPGLVTLLTLESVYVPVASQTQGVMVTTWHDETSLARPWTALLAGPGLAGKEVPDGLKACVTRNWREAAFPMVVDASALEWLPHGVFAEGSIRVITPHPGEAARLLATSVKAVQSDRVQALRDLSETLGNCWVVLKGHQTLVGRTGSAVYVNPSGNPHLGQGGTGDLLGGFIAGLLAQPELQLAPDLLIRYAVWRHGHAADSLRACRPNWTVEELADELGK